VSAEPPDDVPDELEEPDEDSPPPRGCADPLLSLPDGRLRCSAQTGVKLSAKAAATAIVSF
jgi:hypothetical protein